MRSALKTSNARLLGLDYHIKCGTPTKSRQDLISYPFALACMQVKRRHKRGPNNGQQAATDGPRRDVVQFSDWKLLARLRVGQVKTPCLWLTQSTG